MNDDQKVLELMINSMVTKPEEVKIDRTVDEMGVLLTLTVAKEDMAQIIGKEGRTASSIRTILRVIGMKEDSRVNLKINEPGEEN